MSFFSVVIPTFNQCGYLKKAIKSVLNQKFRDFEIIIIDNYSSDNTKSIVKKFNNKKILYRKFRNQGVIGASRNLGIRLSKGKWIAFLDSDDSWYREKLQIIYNEIKKNNEIKVFCSNEVIINANNNKKKIWFYGPYRKRFYKYLLTNGNCISTSASVVKKKILKSEKIYFSENSKIVTAEDYDFFLNIAFKGYKFKFLNNILGEHLVHTQSMSSKYEFHKQAVKKVISKHTNRITNNTKFKNFFLFRNSFSIYLSDLSYFLTRKKNYFKSFKIFLFLFVLFPIKLLNFMIRKIKIIILTQKYLRNIRK